MWPNPCFTPRVKHGFVTVGGQIENRVKYGFVTVRDLLLVQNGCPKLVSKIGIQNWCPKLVSKIGVQNWCPKLVSNVQKQDWNMSI
jgi:hypothetical protein